MTAPSDIDLAEVIEGGRHLVRRSRRRALVAAVGCGVAVALIGFGLRAVVHADGSEEAVVPPATVPDVVGLAQGAAAEVLSDADLLVEVVTGPGPAGVVVDQQPGAGQSIPDDRTVVITVGQATPPGTVPDVVGLTEGDAGTVLSDAGLTATVTPGAGEAGVVVDQDPDAGEPVPDDGIVVITVGEGEPDRPTVPDVVGLTEDEATTVLTDAGLTVEPTTGPGDAGVVVDQAPDAGRPIPDDEIVIITIGDDPTPTVPDVVGMAEAQARNVLEAAGLSVDVTTGPGDAGIVVGQDPDAGQPVPGNELVILTVGEGDPPDPPEENVPD